MQTKEQRLFFVILLPPKHTTYGDKLVSFGGETISYDAYDHPNISAFFLNTTKKSIEESSMHVDLNTNDSHNKIYRKYGWIVWQ